MHPDNKYDVMHKALDVFGLLLAENYDQNNDSLCDLAVALTDVRALLYRAYAQGSL
jgi:hypothetical protein